MADKKPSLLGSIVKEASGYNSVKRSAKARTATLKNGNEILQHSFEHIKEMQSYYRDTSHPIAELPLPLRQIILLNATHHLILMGVVICAIILLASINTTAEITELLQRILTNQSKWITYSFILPMIPAALLLIYMAGNAYRTIALVAHARTRLPLELVEQYRASQPALIYYGLLSALSCSVFAAIPSAHSGRLYAGLCVLGVGIAALRSCHRIVAPTQPYQATPFSVTQILTNTVLMRATHRYQATPHAISCTVATALYLTVVAASAAAWAAADGALIGYAGIVLNVVVLGYISTAYVAAYRMDTTPASEPEA